MDVELAQTLVELEAYRNTVKQLKEELEKLKNKNKALEMYADLADEKIDELKEKLAGAERIRDNLRQIGFPTFQSCKEYAERIAELEKESKFYYEERCNYKVAFLKGVVEKNKINKALTKAKEIMQNLLDVAKFYSVHRDKSTLMDVTPIYEAEDFLKED